MEAKNIPPLKNQVYVQLCQHTQSGLCVCQLKILLPTPKQPLNHVWHWPLSIPAQRWLQKEFGNHKPQRLRHWSKGDENDVQARFSAKFGNHKPQRLRHWSKGDENNVQARFSAKRANGLAKPTNGLASRSAGLGFDLHPNTSPSPKKPVGAGTSPFESIGSVGNNSTVEAA
ncbi:hypothetical protein DFH08DRAFT_801699 [Mycena albidolilacea]|uniref:Uncharacterized protein n=1 Tax=Mycena albidolilacea TaxID=1033008 RepID=A0AAD7F185_9AGAR|nr:hypothetical protein DFH08DRAFT_801699 [Mycena albidolilacea]